MQMNKEDHHIFSIDKNGKIKGNFNFVSYMKVAPRNLEEEVLEKAKEDKKTMSDAEIYGINALRMVDSKDWPIARTIFGSLSLKASINIKKIDQKT